MWRVHSVTSSVCSKCQSVTTSLWRVHCVTTSPCDEFTWKQFSGCQSTRYTYASQQCITMITSNPVAPRIDGDKPMYSIWRPHISFIQLTRLLKTVRLALWKALQLARSRNYPHMSGAGAENGAERVRKSGERERAWKKYGGSVGLPLKPSNWLHCRFRKLAYRYRYRLQPLHNGILESISKFRIQIREK